jgi:hypothetical protein
MRYTNIITSGSSALSRSAIIASTISLGVLVLPPNTYADTNTTTTDENGIASTAVYFYADTSKMTVSVPASIYLCVDNSGSLSNITTNIINKSMFSVHLSNIKLMPITPFTIGGTDTDAKNYINYTLTPDTTNSSATNANTITNITGNSDITPSFWNISANNGELAVSHTGTLSNISIDLGNSQQCMTIQWTFANGNDKIQDKDTLEEYSWDELKTIADDLSTNGESSQYYEHMESLMLMASTKTVTLDAVDNDSSTPITAGTTVTVQAIGINHDIKTDGTKAGLTFRIVNDDTNGLPTYYANNEYNTDGWENSAMRNWIQKVVAPAFTTAIPQIASVIKYTHNEAGNSNYGTSTSTEGATATATIDQVFLPSVVEIWGTLEDNWTNAYFFPLEGSQYEYYAENGVTSKNYDILASNSWNWLRSPDYATSTTYRCISDEGNSNFYKSGTRGSIVPCFAL